MTTWPQRKSIRLGTWEVGVWWSPVAGVPQVVGVDIRSFHSDETGAVLPGDDGGLAPVDGKALGVVTKRMLRDQLPWESIREDTRRGLRLDNLWRGNAADDPDVRRRARERVKALRARHRASYPDEHYPEVGRIYNAAVESGNPHPTSVVRDRLIHPRVQPDRAKARATASNWVRRARELGFIPSTDERGSK